MQRTEQSIELDDPTFWRGASFPIESFIDWRDRPTTEEYCCTFDNSIVMVTGNTTAGDHVHAANAPAPLAVARPAARSFIQAFAP